MEEENHNSEPPALIQEDRHLHPELIVLLMLSLLFLWPSISYFIHWLTMKTTVDRGDLKLFDENPLFPLSLLAACLGFRHSTPGSAWRRTFPAIYLLCLLLTLLITPCYILGGFVLGIGFLFVDEQRTARGQFYKFISRVFMMGLGLLAFLVPVNFFQASTRSRVARVKGDQRTITIALETYYLDHNQYPPFTLDLSKKDHWHSRSPMPALMRPGPGAPPETLTTPVAYITTLYTDPCSYLDEDRTFAYYTPPDWTSYILISAGPNCVFDLTLEDLERNFRPNPSPEQWKVFVNATYDPSNGTHSAGDVYRTKM